MASKENALGALGEFKVALEEARSRGAYALDTVSGWYDVIAAGGLEETAAVINTSRDQLGTALGNLTGAIGETEQAESTAHQAN